MTVVVLQGPVHKHRARVDPRHQGAERGGGDAGSLDSQVFCHPN